jgi:hypothetical protein
MIQFKNLSAALKIAVISAWTFGILAAIDLILIVLNYSINLA